MLGEQLAGGSGSKGQAGSWSLLGFSLCSLVTAIGPKGSIGLWMQRVRLEVRKEFIRKRAGTGMESLGQRS